MQLHTYPADIAVTSAVNCKQYCSGWLYLGCRIICFCIICFHEPTQPGLHCRTWYFWRTTLYYQCLMFWFTAQLCCLTWLPNAMLLQSDRCLHKSGMDHSTCFLLSPMNHPYNLIDAPHMRPDAALPLNSVLPYRTLICITLIDVLHIFSTILYKITNMASLLWSLCRLQFTAALQEFDLDHSSVDHQAFWLSHSQHCNSRLSR